MTVEELIDELEILKRTKGAEAMVWTQLDRGIDTISRVVLENDLITLIPTNLDSA